MQAADPLWRTCVETTLGTRMIVFIPSSASAGKFAEKIRVDHLRHFPGSGEVVVRRLNIRYHGNWYAFTFDEGPMGFLLRGTEGFVKAELEVLPNTPAELVAAMRVELRRLQRLNQMAAALAGDAGALIQQGRIAADGAADVVFEAQQIVEDGEADGQQVVDDEVVEDGAVDGQQVVEDEVVAAQRIVEDGAVDGQQVVEDEVVEAQPIVEDGVADGQQVVEDAVEEQIVVDGDGVVTQQVVEDEAGEGAATQQIVEDAAAGGALRQPVVEDEAVDGAVTQQMMVEDAAAAWVLTQREIAKQAVDGTATQQVAVTEEVVMDEAVDGDKTQPVDTDMNDALDAQQDDTAGAVTQPVEQQANENRVRESPFDLELVLGKNQYFIDFIRIKNARKLTDLYAIRKLYVS